MISIRIVHVCDDFDGHKKARKTPVRPTRIDRAPIGALRATIALRSLCLFVANGLVFGGLSLVASAALGNIQVRSIVIGLAGGGRLHHSADVTLTNKSFANPRELPCAWGVIHRTP
jgi:hypothetical protein